MFSDFGGGQSTLPFATSLNDSGILAFVAEASGDGLGPLNDTAVWTIEPGGSPAFVVRGGGPAIDTGGTFTALSAPAINGIMTSPSMRRPSAESSVDPVSGAELARRV